ncbi:Nitrilase [Candidatus Methanobinarius endosymbioticus]|uniref:Nitrilase n=1 Tax=Candidatus Methanobinarius endosymbioticus TaxID=2006182 RepID=A0A366MA01_9EURY|nr:Nitrilase [Candidatus Methanobinarius endosymbioticus]
MTKKLKLALCQMNVVDNKEKNIKKAIEMIENANKEDVDLVILPEMFNCPYENEKFVEYSESKYDSYTLNSIGNIANSENIHILTGSIPEKELDKKNNLEKIYNTSFLLDNNGEILGYHRKMHLFDIDVKDNIYFKESDTLSAGNRITVIDTKSKLGKIGIGICYDIRFPELSRLMALEGAKIIIFPGAFNLTTGPAHWEILFKTRALDNQVFTIGVSPALDKKANYNAYGHSLIIDPWGEIIKGGNFEEELIFAEIDLDKIKTVREELPLLKNRRTDIYDLEKL